MISLGSNYKELLDLKYKQYYQTDINRNFLQPVVVIKIMIDNNQQLKKKSPPHLIFSLMTLTNILINLDHGILPACTNQLKETYSMSDTQLGFLGSIVYLGIVIMGTFAGQFYLRFNSKLLTIIAFFALQASLLFFVLSENKILAYLCRFLTGVCQVFLLVFYPVWIDKFGEESKTLWLTLLQICVPVGIFAGYGITSVIVGFDLSFRWSFFIQITLVALFLIIFVIIPKQKLDAKRADEQNFEQMFGSEIKTPLTENLIPSQQSLYNSTIKQKKKKKHSWWHNMKRLMRSKMYIIGTLTMSVILFVSTGVQFWLTDYFVNVLNCDPTSVYIAYAVISITGPTSGCGFGGYVINKLGGYQSHKTIYVVFLFSAIGIGSAIVLPFIDQFIIDAILLWIVLFFGGSMMPGLTGLMMSSVPPHLRAFGNSNGEIIKNIFGYLPAPFFYGWCNQLLNSQRAGLRLVMFWGLFAPLLLGTGSIIQFRKNKKRQEKIRKRSLENPSLITVQQDPKLISSSSEVESQISSCDQEDSPRKNKLTENRFENEKQLPNQPIKIQEPQQTQNKQRSQKQEKPFEGESLDAKNDIEQLQNKEQKNTNDQLNKRISQDDLQ